MRSVAVAELVDVDADVLLAAVAAVRDRPPPLGQVPARLAALAHAPQQLRGVHLREPAAAEAAGEPAAAGSRGTADLLVGEAGLPAWRARADRAVAGRLAGLPGLLDTVAAGALELPAATLLARAWAALPARLRDEPTAAALIELGQLVDLRDLRRKVDELVAALAPDVTDADLADARTTGELVLVDVGAQNRLSGHTTRSPASGCACRARRSSSGRLAAGAASAVT